ncbi:hypothetical protein Pelo_12402 [Pelomyxa schiedti]|nr:hypothetical protein Pelo_12402 [Pelomyxa schiedti]
MASTTAVTASNERNPDFNDRPDFVAMVIHRGNHKREVLTKLPVEIQQRVARASMQSHRYTYIKFGSLEDLYYCLGCFGEKAMIPTSVPGFWGKFESPFGLYAPPIASPQGHIAPPSSPAVAHPPCQQQAVTFKHEPIDH